MVIQVPVNGAVAIKIIDTIVFIRAIVMVFFLVFITAIVMPLSVSEAFGQWLHQYDLTFSALKWSGIRIRW